MYPSLFLSKGIVSVRVWRMAPLSPNVKLSSSEIEYLGERFDHLVTIVSPISKRHPPKGGVFLLFA